MVQLDMRLCGLPLRQKRVISPLARIRNMEIPMERGAHPNVGNHPSTESTKVGRFIKEAVRLASTISIVPGNLILVSWQKNKLSDRLHKNTPATGHLMYSCSLIKPHIEHLVSLSARPDSNRPRQLNDSKMARLSSVTGPAAPDPTSINLNRMLSRLQHILINSDGGTETKLRSSSYEREKVGTVRSLGHSSPEDANYAIHLEHRVCADPPPTPRARRSPNKDPEQEASSHQVVPFQGT